MYVFPPLRRVSFSISSCAELNDDDLIDMFFFSRLFHFLFCSLLSCPVLCHLVYQCGLYRKAIQRRLGLFLSLIDLAFMYCVYLGRPPGWFWVWTELYFISKGLDDIITLNAIVHLFAIDPRGHRFIRPRNRCQLVSQAARHAWLVHVLYIIVFFSPCLIFPLQLQREKETTGRRCTARQGSIHL